MSSLVLFIQTLSVALLWARCSGQAGVLHFQAGNQQRDMPTLPPPPPPSPGSANASSVTMPELGINGIFPGLTATAESGGTRSECGIGALMPWNDRLYMVSYLTNPSGGSGTGLYEINDKFVMTKIANHTSTYANRLLHKETSQIIIGAWAIDAKGNVKTFKELLKHRLGGTAEHLTHPARLVYMLSMDGPLWECDVILMNCTLLFNLIKALSIPVDLGEQPHFKAAHTMNGRLVVASNTFDEADFVGLQKGGRLAEWKGPGTNWTILAHTAFVEVTGRRNFGRVMYALGWDAASVILKVFDGANPDYNTWQTYRLPKGSHAYDHLWQTEWPRIREVETERYLVDMHGLFYELSPLGWAGSTWGLRPISQHLRMIPDFTSYRGFLVLGGNQVSPIFDNNVVTGQAQSGLWFGKTDDLWSFGKPQGWGGVWRRTQVKAKEPSDPYLMTGFDHKVLHLYANEGLTYDGVTVTVEVDVTGAAGHLPTEGWLEVTSLLLHAEKEYAYYIFPRGYSAHWVRLVPSSDCVLTAYFHYT